MAIGGNEKVITTVQVHLLVALHYVVLVCTTYFHLRITNFWSKLQLSKV